MIHIGRNDPCTCGSGKKYKKCCGKNDVLSMDLLIEQELHDIQLDILQYAMQAYQEEIEGYLEACYEEFDIPSEAMDMFHFFSYTWFITSIEIDDKTIMADYIDRHVQTFNRQRVKDIVQKWRHVRPSVYSVQQQDEHQCITLEDIFTNEIQQVKMVEEGHPVEVGGLILGTVLPAGVTSIFFTTCIDMPASETEKLQGVVVDLYERDGEEDPVKFMAHSFLEVLDRFMFGPDDVTIEDVEWDSPQQQEVAITFQQYMEDKGYEETIFYLGIFFWKKYCLERQPIIKKASVHVAALIYLVHKILPFGGVVTQKKLAEEFGISSSSLSSKFKELETVLYKEIKEIQDKLELVDME